MNTTTVREVTLKYRGQKRKISPFMASPEVSADFLRKVIPDNVREHFLAIYLSGSHQVAGFSVVAVGTANSCPVHAREVFQAAVMLGAVAVIVAHNHPSGNVTPSNEDLLVIERLRDAGNIIGIKLLDHLVLTEDNYYSFNEHGKL